MLFVVPVVLFDMLKAKQLACVSESGQKCPAARSLSLRRAWIEIWTTSSPSRSTGRSPYGERGLKFTITNFILKWIGRSPYGERGLKCQHFRRCIRADRSLSLRRAWIEIIVIICQLNAQLSSLSLRRAWIEIGNGEHPEVSAKSLSLRRAWIEITCCPKIRR